MEIGLYHYPIPNPYLYSRAFRATALIHGYIICCLRQHRETRETSKALKRSSEQGGEQAGDSEADVTSGIIDRAQDFIIPDHNIYVNGDYTLQLRCGCTSA